MSSAAVMETTALNSFFRIRAGIEVFVCRYVCNNDENCTRKPLKKDLLSLLWIFHYATFQYCRVKLLSVRMAWESYRISLPRTVTISLLSTWIVFSTKIIFIQVESSSLNNASVPMNYLLHSLCQKIFLRILISLHSVQIVTAN